MRLYVVGLIMNDGKLEACQIYNSQAKRNEKKVMLVGAELLKKAIRKDWKIIGLRKSGDSFVLNDYYRYNAKHLDKLNGAGYPLTPENERREVLIGTTGFKEKELYRVVNSIGIPRDITYEELCRLTKENKIVGAYITNKQGKEVLLRHKDCKVRIYPPTN